MAMRLDGWGGPCFETRAARAPQHEAERGCSRRFHRLYFQTASIVLAQPFHRHSGTREARARNPYPLSLHDRAFRGYGFRVRSRSLSSGRALRGPVGERPGMTAASAIALATHARPSHSADAPFGKRSEGARDAGGPDAWLACAASARKRTHGLQCLATPERNGDLGRAAVLSSKKPQVRLLSSVPRAVFEACSARPPVG